MKKNNDNIGKGKEIFTLTFNESWFDNDIFRQKYRIISDIKETKDGYEYIVAPLDNKKLLE